MKTLMSKVFQGENISASHAVVLIQRYLIALDMDEDAIGVAKHNINSRLTGNEQSLTIKGFIELMVMVLYGLHTKIKFSVIIKGVEFEKEILINLRDRDTLKEEGKYFLVSMYDRMNDILKINSTRRKDLENRLNICTKQGLTWVRLLSYLKALKISKIIIQVKVEDNDDELIYRGEIHV